MSEAERIWDELDTIFSRWGLNEIPFSESASTLRRSQLQEVFTGRTEELKHIFNLFRSRERKRVLVYGWLGIGKTAFILEALSVLQRKDQNAIVTYISLPPETDLPTAAFIALARKMADDEWAQRQLNQFGLRPRKPVRRHKGRIKAGISLIESEIEEEISGAPLPRIPFLGFEDLLERALNRHRRVVIAIDDLDKQDPALVRRLLHEAQGMLKGEAWFIISGHPGLTRDVLVGERGLFDLALRLEELDLPTTYRMLVNYLNSARSKETRYAPDDPLAAHPFTQETARILCERSGGVPRWLNRLGSYVLLKAAELQAHIITPEVLEQGLEYADRQLRGQPGLTPRDYYVLDLVLERGILSDATVTLADLERVRVREFSEILPVLEKLVRLDLVYRTSTEYAFEYAPTPMLSGKHRAHTNQI